MRRLEPPHLLISTYCLQSRSCSHLVLVFRGLISVKAKIMLYVKAKMPLGCLISFRIPSIGRGFWEWSFLPEMYMKCLTCKYLKK